MIILSAPSSAPNDENPPSHLWNIAFYRTDGRTHTRRIKI